jgi:hypothetical protein
VRWFAAEFDGVGSWTLDWRGKTSGIPNTIAPPEM